MTRLTRILPERLLGNRIGEAEPVEDSSGLVAHHQHHPMQPALVLGDAVLAGFVGVAAGAGEQAERAAGEPDDRSVADFAGRPGEPIAAVAAAAAGDELLADHLREHHGEELGRYVL